MTQEDEKETKGLGERPVPEPHLAPTWLQSSWLLTSDPPRQEAELEDGYTQLHLTGGGGEGVTVLFF